MVFIILQFPPFISIKCKKKKIPLITEQSEHFSVATHKSNGKTHKLNVINPVNSCY